MLFSLGGFRVEYKGLDLIIRIELRACIFMYLIVLRNPKEYSGFYIIP